MISPGFVPGFCIYRNRGMTAAGSDRPRVRQLYLVYTVREVPGIRENILTAVRVISDDRGSPGIREKILTAVRVISDDSISDDRGSSRDTGK